MTAEERAEEIVRRLSRGPLGPLPQSVVILLTIQIREAEEAAIRDEREACAGLAEAAGRRGSEAGADAEQLAYLDGREAAADDAANAIRARSEA